MNRPEVRIIQNQQESEPIQKQVSKDEEEYLLWKYYGGKQPQQTPEPQGESFEEMVAKQNPTKPKPQRPIGERPITFSGNSYTDTNYGSIETPDGELNLKITINSTMPIPKRY